MMGLSDRALATASLQAATHRPRRPRAVAIRSSTTGWAARSAAIASELSATSQRNCDTSGFEAAGAPTGDYGLDVHIETGLLGLTSQTLLQDYLIEPVWIGLVWVVHTLIVAFEWCFTLDLLDSAAIGSLEHSLRATQTSFTGPWLVAALALAALAAAYNGLVRRRVAETLGQSGADAGDDGGRPVGDRRPHRHRRRARAVGGRG